jgi:hypothetical protein
MKLPILFLFLMAYSTALYAQNPRIENFGDRRTETYKYNYRNGRGGDSIRFTILGKSDTLQVTKYYYNGKPNEITWKKDSVYLFDELGEIRVKYYLLNKNRFKKNGDKAFYANGQLMFSHLDTNQLLETARYEEDGRRTFFVTKINKPHVTYERYFDSQDRSVTFKRIDTITNGKKISLLSHDTIFYDNGLPYQISVQKDYNNRELVESKWYNKDGSLAKSLLHDSLRLVIFKDNIDCFYGLKNKQGDTIVQPRFDRIKGFNDDFWAAYSGKSIILLNADGSPMTPVTTQLSEVSTLRRHNVFFTQSWNMDSRRSDLIKPFVNYYSFKEGDKFGVMTEKGTLVMPPQYLTILTEYIEDKLYFQFMEMKEDSTLRSGFLNRQGKDIFPKDFKKARYTNYEDYFFISYNRQIDENPIERYNYDVIKNNDASKLFELAPSKNVLGLGKAETKVLLEPKFCYIKHLDNSSLFIASIIKTNNTTKTGVFYDGIFDTRSQRWLLDTTHFVVNFCLDNTFVIKHVPSGKYGIMDTLGKYIVPLMYDSIGVANSKKGLFWIKKAGKYQILEMDKGHMNIHKSKYEFLNAVSFFHNDVTYFLAKRTGKWGIIDVNERIILPFDYEYASIHTDYTGFIMVKDNRAAAYTLQSLPNEMPYLPHVWDNNPFTDNGKPTKKTIFDYRLVDNYDRIFFVNDTGKVMIPPQYKLLKTDFNLGYALVEDAKKDRKTIFFESGKVVDYPFNYKIEVLHSKSRVIVVKDSVTRTYGVVSTDGKLLMPCINYGAAIGDVENSVFFIKRDKPIVPDGDDTLTTRYHTDFDTLNGEDTHWLMYNQDGKLLSDAPFKFPINFQNGIGVGMKDDNFNLYKSDGAVFNIHTEGSVLQTYQNIRRDKQMGFYALFYNQGLTPMMILTNKNGQILVKSGLYDGISRFYDKYALVSSAGKIGLIDTSGQEIIAPQDLRTYKGHFIDSLDLSNKLVRRKKYRTYEESYNMIPQPLDFYTGQNNGEDPKWHPDSLAITDEQRTALYNLMLEKCLPNVMATVSDLAIPRVELRSNTRYFKHYRESEEESSNPFVIQRAVWEYQGMTPRNIAITNNSIAFTLSKYEHSFNEGNHFYNFYRRNNRWEELKINDLLNIQGEKRGQLNEQLIKKIKALKEGEIDCSNTSAFITTVENRFLLTKKGIDFCFDSLNYNSDLVIVSFTWAELAPFLKMKISEK